MIDSAYRDALGWPVPANPKTDAEKVAAVKSLLRQGREKRASRRPGEVLKP